MTTGHPTAVELLSRGLAAVAAGDWSAVRALCGDDVAWHTPGDSSLAGTITGVDAVIERFTRMTTRVAAAGDGPATMVTLMGAGDYAVAVQRNTLTTAEGRSVDVTMLTLATFREGRLVELQYFTSHQDLVDQYWSRM